MKLLAELPFGVLFEFFSTNYYNFIAMRCTDLNLYVY